MNRLSSCLVVLLCLLASCKSPEELEYEMYLVNGEALYQQHCANCHGRKGEGLRNLYPALEANALIAGNTEALICLIREGRKADKGRTSQAMPANTALYDLDIAQLVTFLRKNFGQAEPADKITTEKVKNSLADCRN